MDQTSPKKKLTPPIIAGIVAGAVVLAGLGGETVKQWILRRLGLSVVDLMNPDDINDIRRIGTAALELSLIAEGAADMYFEIRLSPWDYAAGLTILREAGGCYTGIGDGDVSFEGPSPVLAANSEENLRSLKAVVDREFDGRTPYRRTSRRFLDNP